MLEYIALGMLVFVAITLFYGVIVIHDIPYEIAKKRNHPQQDALHVAGWVSLFTLHVLWPFLWIWATLYQPDRGWGFSENSNANKNDGNANDANNASNTQLIELQKRVELLEVALQNEMDRKQELIDIDKSASKLFADLDNINEQQGDK
ncbi:DUF3302 domain-containing protein [Psychromonas aquatilis]|uniref:DUF3302 domain-containing protein n=1 Tax=Psychromonas aquatilis TaxID=2005072 RepID=A0ABU9GRH2_9GAMM